MRIVPTWPAAAALAVAALLAGCDAGAPPPAPGPGTPAPAARPAPVAPRVDTAETVAATARDPLAARTREAVNPDDRTMVLLYVDLASIDPPWDAWIERDPRVVSARPVDKAVQRDVVKAELQAAVAAVRDIGRLRLSVGNARLSDYDPGYGEFTIGALSPASQLAWAIPPYKVTASFTNAITVQHWRVPAAQASRCSIAWAAVALRWTCCCASPACSQVSAAARS